MYLQWIVSTLMTGVIFMFTQSPQTRLPVFLHSLILIEPHPYSLWLASILAFNSLFIPTALSTQIKYPLIPHRRPFNWDFSHLAYLPEHQRHQSQHELSKLNLCALILPSSQPTPGDYFYNTLLMSSLHRSLMDNLFHFIILNPSFLSFSSLLPLIKHTHRPRGWNPFCCITWEYNWTPFVSIITSRVQDVYSFQEAIA